MLNLIPSLPTHLLTRSFRELGNDRRGVTALEYGLLAGLIAVALIGVLTTFGKDVEGLFTSVSTDVTAVGPTTAGTGT
jgi:pilus assembly protein Flp/PilA